MLKEIKYPDKNHLEKQFLRNYGEQFLSLNNLKVGEVIEIEFPYHQLKSNYKQTARYTYLKLCKGILKLDEWQCLYAESIDNLPFYDSVSISRGRHIKSEYVRLERRSIVKFGTGFIH